MFVTLKPKAERKASSDQIMQRLRVAVRAASGINVYFQNVQNINIGATATRALWQYTLQSADFQELRDVTPKLEERIRRVAGVVDLHAAAVDTPATDVARLFGSWSGGADIPLADARAGAIEAYEAVRPLDPRERALVPWLDATGTIFAIDSWFRWVLLEGRRFERPVRVVERVDRLLDRLAPAFEWLDRWTDAV